MCQTMPQLGFARQVAAGQYFGCALNYQGRITCWPSSEGVAFAASEMYVAVTAGQQFACGLTATGAVRCAGSNAWTVTPTASLTFSAISAGSRHLCGVVIDGTLWCTGMSDFGQASPPRVVRRVVQVAAGHLTTCFVRADRSVGCFGWRTETALPPAGFVRFNSLSVGAYHAVSALLTAALTDVYSAALPQMINLFCAS